MFKLIICKMLIFILRHTEKSYKRASIFYYNHKLRQSLRGVLETLTGTETLIRSSSMKELFFVIKNLETYCEGVQFFLSTVAGFRPATFIKITLSRIFFKNFEHKYRKTTLQNTFSQKTYFCRTTRDCYFHR